MMMGERQVDQSAFYEFSLERHVPGDHMLRSIDCFVDLGAVRRHLAPFYSTTGWPSVDPELLPSLLCYLATARAAPEVDQALVRGWPCRWS
jgi:transposase